MCILRNKIEDYFIGLQDQNSSYKVHINYKISLLIIKLVNTIIAYQSKLSILYLYHSNSQISIIKFVTNFSDLFYKNIKIQALYIKFDSLEPNIKKQINITNNYKLTIASSIQQSMSLQRSDSSPTKSNPSYFKSTPDLYIRISINQQQPETSLYPILNNSQFQYDDKNANKNVLCIKIDTILKIASSLIMKKKIKITRFMNIFVEVQKKRVNIFKLKKAIALPGNSSFNSQNVIKIKRQDQSFYLDIFVIQIKMIESNPLLQLTQQKVKYNAIIQKLKQVNQMFTKQLKSLNDEQKRSYDIAYFFAEPLVQPSDLNRFLNDEVNSFENLKLDEYWGCRTDVSFQKQYDRFVKLLKQDNFFQNITIQMMVATQYNIKQVLNQRCNILHFSCHGQKKCLKIQDSKNIGYLDPLTAQRLIKLLQGRILPKIILFNACYSNILAQKIHNRFPSIITLGYDGAADDKYCQLLTERLYSGIYQKKQSIGKIVDDVVKQIQKQNQLQSKKLKLFCNSRDIKLQNQKTLLAQNQKWNVDWAYLQNLGPQQPLGIKKRLYNFIKDYLMNRQRQLIFIIGNKECGKSIFMKKTLLFTMHRNMFQEKLFIDCFQGQKNIVNMLHFKILYKKAIFQKINQNKTVNLIIVIDHCNYLIRNQPQQFIQFFRKVQKQLKLGKIIIITDSVFPLTDINKIRYEREVFQYKQIQIQHIKKQLQNYLIRWYPYIQKKFEPLKKYSLSILMKALRTSSSNKKFIENLQKLNQQWKLKDNLPDVVNFHQEMARFKDKIVSIQRKIKKFITYGYYSRNFDQFILIDIFKDFGTNQTKQQASSQFPVTSLKLTPQRRQKSQLIQSYHFFYQSQIKNLIEKLVSSLSKFKKPSLSQSQEQQNFMYITEKIFIVVGLTILINQPKEVQNQLLNCYTLTASLMNRYPKLLTTYPKLLAQCEGAKLKICMSLYNIYKNQYYVSYYQQLSRKNKKSSTESYIKNNQSTNFADNQDFFIGSGGTSQYPQQRDFRDSFNESRDSVNLNFARRQSATSQIKNNSKIVEQTSLQRKKSKNKQSAKKESCFDDFQKLIKQQYGGSIELWQLIHKVQQMDTIIRMIKFQQNYEIKQSNLINTLNPSSLVFQSSIPQSHRKFYQIYCQVQNFYKLHQNIIQLSQKFTHIHSSDEDQYFITNSNVKKLFFSQKQLQICYLYGLKLVEKLFASFSSQYLFDYQQWYKQKFRRLRDILVRAQKILDKKIGQKILKNHDFSYKKIYKQFMQKYIDLRYNLQKSYSSFAINGQKRLLGIFQKLLKFAQDIKSIQLKNRIQDYIQKSFYNKCSILISEPLGYLRREFYNDKKKTDHRHGESSKNLHKQLKNKEPKKDKQVKKQKITLKSKKQNYSNQDFSSEKEHFFPLNILRHSQMIINQMKNQTQNSVESQIHIQIQTLSYQKLKSFRRQIEDKKKKRLIYLILCDCKQSQHHQSIYLQNQYGESIKYWLKTLQSDSQISFPYAPVIILYGSSADTLKYFYKQKFKTINKKMAFISLKTEIKKPEIEGDFSSFQQYCWNEYIQKQIGINFLSHFWRKFCQTYFDQQHQSFQNQVIRSFNIAKLQSIILLKKKYCQGLSKSQIQKSIDSIIDNSNIWLQFINVTSIDPPIRLDNNLKSSNSGSNKLLNSNYTFQLSLQRQQSLVRNISQTQSAYIRRQQQILAMYHRQIGTNMQVYSFLQQFFSNIKQFEQNNNKDYTKSWIKYHPQINQTNLYTFTKTIYYKLLRLGSKFEHGIEFKDLTIRNTEQYQQLYRQNFDLQDSFLDNKQMTISMDFQQQSQYINWNLSSEIEQQKCKKKKVQIYYNVPYHQLRFLFENFKIKDQYMMKYGHRSGLGGHNQIGNGGFLTASDDLVHTFRILIVNTTYFDPQMQFSLQKPYSCKISPYDQKISSKQNSYHICDTILNYSKKIQNFSFEQIIQSIYKKKQTQEDLKKKTPKQLKDKIIQYFQRNSINFMGHSRVH